MFLDTKAFGKTFATIFMFAAFFSWVIILAFDMPESIGRFEPNTRTFLIIVSVFFRTLLYGLLGLVVGRVFAKLYNRYAKQNLEDSQK